MVVREFWKKRIEAAWKHRPVVWLSGVRRVGKTTLCQSLDNIAYFDCELPRVRQLFEDPEQFLQNTKGKRIVIDEIHRLKNPSELLKIAADYFPDNKIIATGSSTLGASAKFSDTLAGRKSEIWLTPMLYNEADLFGNSNIEHRLLYGGLPPFFSATILPEKDYQEWLDAYWAKDIQELFRLEKRYSFQKFVELLMAQSGDIFEATRFTSRCEVSRITISNYLAVLEQTFVVHVIRPFSTHRPTEIVSAPKVYGFDTGFVCHNKGWEKLRSEDKGNLWEHLVLNEMQGQLQTKTLHYWRDKQGHEIDFIYLKNRQTNPVTIECKWLVKKFDPRSLQSFRKIYPNGKNFVVASDVTHSFEKKFGELMVKFIAIDKLCGELHS